MEDIKRIKKYASIKNRLYLINLILSVVFLCLFLLSGLSFQLKNFTSLYLNNFYLQLALYFLIFSFLLYIIFLSLDYYDSYIIEHRFGLSKHTFLRWLKDNIKKKLLSFALGLLILEILYFFLKNQRDTWWIYAAVAYFLISILLSKFLPVIILPLFYKQNPLEDEVLKKRLMDLCQKEEKRIKGIYSIDLSKETKKANAALVGSGKTRRILLSDTLLDKYSHDEIEVILAHEIAHHNLKHMPKLLAVGGIFSLLGFYIAYIFLRGSVFYFNLEGIYDISGLPVLMLVFLFFSLVIMPLQNAVTRYFEKQADKKALKITGLYDAFISAMQKLSMQNLSDPAPSKFIEIMLYDHPPTQKRIELSKKLKQKTKI